MTVLVVLVLDNFFIEIIATLWAFHNSCSRMWHYTRMMCFAKKLYDIQSHGLIKDKINFELKVRRTYGLLHLLSWPSTCSRVRLRAGWQKLWDQFVSYLGLRKSNFLQVRRIYATAKWRNLMFYAFLVDILICNMKLKVCSILHLKSRIRNDVLFHGEK